MLPTFQFQLFIRFMTFPWHAEYGVFPVRPCSRRLLLKYLRLALYVLFMRCIFSIALFFVFLIFLPHARCT